MEMGQHRAGEGGQGVDLVRAQVIDEMPANAGQMGRRRPADLIKSTAGKYGQ
jgi:hypothetical protein